MRAELSHKTPDIYAGLKEGVCVLQCVSHRVLRRSVDLGPFHRGTLHLEEPVEELLEPMEIFSGDLTRKEHTYTRRYHVTQRDQLQITCPCWTCDELGGPVTLISMFWQFRPSPLTFMLMGLLSCCWAERG